MGKSEGNAIYLIDEPKDIEKKVKRALTDSGVAAPNQPKPDYIENLFTIMRVVSAPEVVEHFDRQWNNAEIRYGDLKKQLAEDIIRVTTPIRLVINDIKANDKYLETIIEEGAEKARHSAAKTIEGVRRLMGVR